MTRIGSLVAALASVLALASCSEAVPVVTPSPTDAFLVAQGEPATGPVERLGGGDAFETVWRFGIYPTEGAPCLQLDLDGQVGARCDGILPADDSTFGSIGVRTPEGSGATFVDGVASEAVATVWLIAADQSRVPALLIPLADFDVDGQAFVGAVGSGIDLTHVMAVAPNGEVLETFELP